MKTTQISSLALLFASAMAGPLSKRDGKVSEVPNPDVDASIPDPARTMFADDSAKNLLYAPPGSASTIPDNVFVVQCLEQGFRGECMVLGGPPGECGMYSSGLCDMNEGES